MIGILKSMIENKDSDSMAIRNMNSLTKTSTNGVIFCDTVANNLKFEIITTKLSSIHAFSFDGILIAEGLEAAQSLKNMTYAKRRLLYLYHLEWPTINNMQFHHLRMTLINDDIDLIARSEHHASLITDLFKAPKYIMPEWDYRILQEIDND